MKNLCKVMLILATSMAATVFAKEDVKKDDNTVKKNIPYSLTLVNETSTVTPPAPGEVLYALKNVWTKSTITQIDNSELHGSVKQVTTLTNPGFNLQPTCPSVPFYLNAGQTCYLKYSINTSTLPFGTVITGQPDICASSTNPPTTCYDAGNSDQNFNVTVGSSAQIIPITVTPAFLDPLVLGQPTSWTITNQCGILPGACTGFINTTANPINVTFSAGGSGAFTAPPDVSACTALAAGQSCKITATVVSSLPPGTPLAFQAFFSGSNTTVATDFPVISPVSGQLVSLLGDIVVFSPSTGSTAPITQCALWVNSGNTPLNITGITTGPNVFHITSAAPPTAPTIPACSGTLNAGALCYVCFIGANNAYGSDTYTINYTGGTSPSSSSNVAVVGTVLEINNFMSINVMPNQASPGVPIPIKNIGTFRPSPDFTVTAPSGSGTVTDITFNNLTACTGAALDPGVTCNAITYTSGPNPTVTGTVNFSVAASNLILNPESEPVTVSGSGAPVVSLGATHLQYQEIKINNTASGATNITSIATNFTGFGGTPSNYVYACNAPLDTGCDYQTSCLSVGLVAGSSCSIWIRSLALGTQPIGAAGKQTGTINVVLNGASSTPFNITQEVILYATGNFDKAGGNSAANIAQWAGTDGWSPLGTGSNGLNGFGNALAIYAGDLFVGGQFTQSNSGSATLPYIASWNGQLFSSIPSTNPATLGCSGCSPANAGVFALAAPLGATSSPSNPVNIGVPLFMGGVFDQISYSGGPATVVANDIAQWNGGTTNPAPIGLVPTPGNGVTQSLPANSSFVKSLFQPNSTSQLYVGGFFDTFTPTLAGTPSPNVGRWNTTNWTGLIGGVGSDSLSSFATDFALNGTNYIVTGHFDCVGSPCATGYNNVAQYVGTWSTLGTGFNATANAADVFGGQFYAGGLFTCDGSVTNPIYRIATFSGTTWSTVANGLGAQPATACGNDTNEYVQVIRDYNGAIYAGGFFTTSTTSPAPLSNIASSDGTTNWGSLSATDITSVTGTVSVNDILITNTLTVTP